MMRSSIGPILHSPSGKETYRRLLQEIADIAHSQSDDLDTNIVEATFSVVEQQAPTMKSSMLRDMEKGNPIEADHLHGSLLDVAPEDLDVPILQSIYAALKVYERNEVSANK